MNNALGADRDLRVIIQPIRIGGDTHRDSYPRWVFYFGKKQLKSCVQIVTTRIHVHSQSFITYQKHWGIILTRFLNAFLIPFYNKQVTYDFSRLLTRRSQVQILAPLPKNIGESQRCGFPSFLPYPAMGNLAQHVSTPGRHRTDPPPSGSCP
jgi:hypothetical protein